MKSSVYFIDDRFVEKPLISLEDRGFFFADSVYEVIRAKYTRTYFLDEHLKRLRRGLSELKIKYEFSDEWIKGIIHEALSKLNLPEVTIYIQVTRGKEARSHMPKPQTKPTFVMVVSEFKPLSGEVLHNGVSLIFYDDIRWGRCDIKTTMLLPNVLAKMEAKKRGFFDAVFVKKGIITESTSSSFFALKDRKLITHPATRDILPSITRAKVIDVIAPQLGYRVEGRPLSIEELKDIEGAFLAGTTYDILPVNRVEDITITVSDGVWGIQEAYFELVNKSLR